MISKPTIMSSAKSKKNIEAIYRLSPLQEGVLYHSLKSASSDMYFQQYSCILQSLDDVDKWQDAWASNAKKHPIMRTLFTWQNREQPLQIVREQVNLLWQQHDWSEYSTEQQALNWTSLLRRDRDRGFDFTAAPLMRFTLVKIAQGSYRFLWSFHHILIDGWSQRLLFNAALSYYHSPNTLLAATVKAPPYSDFIDWLKNKQRAEEKQFWLRQLSGFKTPTNIRDISIPKNEDHQSTGSHVTELKLQSNIVLQLKNASRTERITLNSLVLGAWARVLATECRSDDVVFGTTVSGRPVDLKGADQIAGLFINTLPCRVQLTNAHSLADWLTEIQSDQARCREHEQTSLADIQQWSDVPKSISLFESIIVFENLPADDTSEISTGLVVTDPEYVELSHYPLAILIDPSEGLKLIAVHKLENIGILKAKRLLTQLEFTLSQFAENLSKPCGKRKNITINDLSILSAIDRQVMLEKCNQTDVQAPRFGCIHQYFEYWAQKTPDAIALIAMEIEHSTKTSLSYKELNSKANRLAHFLKIKGVTQEYLIPVLIEQKADVIIAFLAVLKVGAAYVPLDTGYPKSRIEHILKDVAHADSVLLSHVDLSDKIPEFIQRCIYLDDTQQIEDCPPHNLGLEIAGSQLAYVIYTSGSTGHPKGVMIEHQSLVNSTVSREQFYPEQPGSFLLLSSFATDSSVAGLYWTLSSGATLVVADGRLEQDLAKLEQVILDTKISHLLCIPSLYQLILEHCDVQKLDSLNTVIVAGEACLPSVIQQHQKMAAKRGLYNEYGPSECTVWATGAALHSWQHGDFVPIGKPIANTQVYVLDANHQPVPIGVMGELCIGGTNLAKGYFNQPDKTAAVFIDNPLGAVPVQRSARIYKTGDLVRLHEDGSLEFIGRVDNQIKLRGFRIEPEEIEKTLSSHPMVKEAVVFLDDGIVLDSQVKTICDDLALLEPEQVEQLLQQVEQCSDDKIGFLTNNVEPEIKL